MDWEKRLQSVCLKVPLDVGSSAVTKLCAQYLRERKGKTAICKYCKHDFAAKNKRDLIYLACPDCKIKRKENAEAEQLKHRWIKPNPKVQEQQFWTGGNDPYTDYALIPKLISKEDIERLKTVDYKEFLSSHYWMVLSRFIKSQQRYCQLCGKSNNLNVHHKNYIHRGEEYHNWRDSLITLCQPCHAKFHDKVGANNG